jgi:hypothetical protein
MGLGSDTIFPRWKQINFYHHYKDEEKKKEEKNTRICLVISTDLSIQSFVYEGLTFLARLFIDGSGCLEVV